MFLKRLEIAGFKSFADRVAIEFDKGITAVVGPNGSGKSNITDAIRWVLGEQSVKSLRGGKMEDIIFAGSANRKPLNFAEVSLILDNGDHFLPVDYNEVMITRRAYRSGESEFFINKQPCRLKDIVDLMMDSGMGREAFSIIGQGKVDEILNSKPEERRTIFEEAAGVLKYKTRKMKAEAKLAETEENLNRVRDILHELEGQLEPLKKQASVAKEYLDLKKELERYEVALLAHDIERLSGEWNALKEKIRSLQDEELELSVQVQKKEAEIERIRDAMRAADRSVDELQQKLLSASEELEKIEGRREVLKERKKNFAENRKALEQALDESRAKLESLKKERETLSAQLAELEGQLAEKRRLLKEKREKLEFLSEDVEEKIESLKSDYIDLLNREAALKNEQRLLAQQLERLESQYEKQKEEKERVLHDRDLLAAEGEELERKRGILAERAEAERERLQKEEQELQRFLREGEVLEEALRKIAQEVHQLKSRKEILQEMEEDLAGFHQGAKEILKAGKKLPGIEGAVAQLIRVEKPYELAVETALSSSLQHIVVRDEECARTAINYLKKHSSGRATFLPMSVIKGRTIPPEQRRHLAENEAFVGIASELVSFQEKHRNIMEYLLGTVIISRHLPGANEIARASGYRYRIVTLDGDVVNPGGSMTGGAVKKNASSLLSRKREMETLEAEIARREEEGRKKRRLLDETKGKIGRLKENLQKAKETEEGLKKEEERVREALKEIEWRRKNLEERLQIFAAEEASFLQEKERIAGKMKENAGRLERIRAEAEEIDLAVKALSEKKSVDQSQKDSLTEEIQALNIQIAKLEEQIRHIKARSESAELGLKETEEDKAEQEKRLEEMIREREEDEKSEAELARLAEEKQKEKNSILDRIAERRQERNRQQQMLEEIEKDVKEWKRLHKTAADRLKEEEVKLGRLDAELDNLLRKLSEEYFLTFEAAKEQYPLPEAPDEARKKAKLIKRSIDELGTVNLGAIEEYERIHERYTFLRDQRDDLLEAKDTLFQVIEEMDQEMIKRFKETFEAVSGEFTSVFRNLFSGGYAELKLTDPDDLLNTGVEIVAQPPGKKLQNLSLLSGGERALTAIALLFSILKVRPVPFCVFDEVEAALDEANVYRFSRYLKKFAEDTQFIVITHRKGTMEEADALYGITMQESGVSKLVSVRLEEQENFV